MEAFDPGAFPVLFLFSENDTRPSLQSEDSSSLVELGSGGASGQTLGPSVDALVTEFLPVPQHISIKSAGSGRQKGGG